ATCVASFCPFPREARSPVSGNVTPITMFVAPASSVGGPPPPVGPDDSDFEHASAARHPQLKPTMTDRLTALRTAIPLRPFMSHLPATERNSSGSTGNDWPVNRRWMRCECDPRTAQLGWLHVLHVLHVPGRWMRTPYCRIVNGPLCRC